MSLLKAKIYAGQGHIIKDNLIQLEARVMLMRDIIKNPLTDGKKADLLNHFQEVERVLDNLIVIDSHMAEEYERQKGETVCPGKQ